MRRLAVAGAILLTTLVAVPATALAEEASPPTTSELEEALPGDAPDVVEDNDDDDGNAGLWGLLGLLGLAGLAGLAGRRRHTDTYTTSTRTTGPPPRGASSGDT
jgi:hypothetical protein